MAELKQFKSRKEWLEARKGGIGGSDAPAILGVDPYRSALEVYADKAGLTESGDDNNILWWGRKLQPIVAQAYRRETERKLKYFGNHFFTSQSRPDLPVFASLDAMIVEPKGILEIKTSEVITRQELEEEIPINWQVQVQHCLGVLGLEMASITIPLPHRKLFWVDIQADKEFIELLFDKEAAFWKHVQERNPPDPDSSESARAVLQKMYPKDTGREIILPETAIEIDRKRIEAMAAIDQMEAIKTQAENDLKALIGDATTGIIGDGLSYTWKHQKKAAYEVKAQEFRVLRRHQKKGGK